jgi:hypothetical protein
MDIDKVLDGMEKAAGTLCPEFSTFSNRVYDIPGWCNSFRDLKRVIASSILQETLKEKANFGTYITSLMAKDSLFKFYLVRNVPEPIGSLDIGRYTGAIYFIMPNGLIIDGEEISVISFCSLPGATGSAVITGTSIKNMKVVQALIDFPDSVITAPLKDNRLVSISLALISKVLSGDFSEQSFVKTTKSGKESWNPGVVS